MTYDETDLHYCHECGSEFVIQAIETSEELTYCPYCGSELYDLDEDYEEEDENRSWD